jgi:hypothetical protein
VTSPKGGQFVLHAKALHGNPYDGHTLGPILAGLEALTGIETRRIHVDKGYRGHNHPHKFRVWISGQVRRVTASIRREMKRRAAVEPVIGHLKAEHRMGRNYLKGPEGDRINAVLAAAGYNFGLLLRWLAELLRAFFMALAQSPPPLTSPDNTLRSDSSRSTNDYMYNGLRALHPKVPIYGAAASDFLGVVVTVAVRGVTAATLTGVRWPGITQYGAKGVSADRTIQY